MKKRNILAGTAAVLVLVFLVVVIAVNHRLQRQNEYLQDLKTQTTDLSSSTDQKEEENQGAEKEREQELDREIAFWSGSEVHSLGLMDLQALSFWAEQNASHPVSGIISCHDFSRQDRNFRLLVYMVCRDGENKLSFRLYQQRQHGYALLKSQESELSLFDSFWDMECRVKVFLRERGDDLEIVCSQQKFRMEGNTKMYQIFRLSENGFEEIFRLVSARETVSARVEKNGEMIYLSSDDGQQTEGVYSDPEEAVARNWSRLGCRNRILKNRSRRRRMISVFLLRQGPETAGQPVNFQERFRTIPMYESVLRNWVFTGKRSLHPKKRPVP